MRNAKRKSLGSLYGQRFFAVRHLPGTPLDLPFRKGHFTAFIEVAVPLSDDALRTIALDLLRHGMRLAVCHGHACERLAEVIDELVDEYEFAHEGRTVYASAHDEESLEEAMEYFILPNGLAETGLLVVLGEEESFRPLLSGFSTVSGDMRERLETGVL